MRDSRLPHLYLLDLVKEETILLSDMDVRERQPAWSPDGKLIAYVREQNFAQSGLCCPMVQIRSDSA
jgi:Tol biopolymer transport system component